MTDSNEELIKVGTYVIIQKQSYRKVHKISENGSVMLGKDQVLTEAILGQPFFSTFHMLPKQNGKRTFTLKVVTHAESWEDLRESQPSGNDNRDITDDGTSQMLSKDEIIELRESGMSGKEIVNSLIENSKSFAAKTEYSQEKYIKKKERKYYRYFSVRKPTIQMLHDVYFRQDHARVGGLRMDSLAQVLSYSDVQAEGLYLLYDSGSMGLPAAAMLSRIGRNTKGNLVYLHPGNTPQTTFIQAMNFPQEQIDRLSMVNIYSFLRLYYQGEETIMEELWKKFKNNPRNRETCQLLESTKVQVELEKNQETEKKVGDAEAKSKDGLDIDSKPEDGIDTERKLKDDVDTQVKESCKRKLESNPENEKEEVPMKKPKWFTETQNVVENVKEKKAVGLVIVAKEHPLNIVEALLPFLGESRPFVIFHSCREPLQETYVALKQRHDIVNLKLFSNFLRSYQVLPDRTHPDILTDDNGGYILTGYLVER